MLNYVCVISFFLLIIIKSVKADLNSVTKVGCAQSTCMLSKFLKAIYTVSHHVKDGTTHSYLELQLKCL